MDKMFRNYVATFLSLSTLITHHLVGEEECECECTCPPPPPKYTRVFIIGDFLYWMANEEGLDYAYKAKGTPGVLPLTDIRIKEFDPTWNFGFRVGLGYRLPHDCWEVRGYVTQYRTTNHLETTAHDGQFIEPMIGTLPDAPLSFGKEEGTWHLKYTLMDLELARGYLLGKSFMLSPFLGGRGAWINQDLHLKFRDALPPTGTSSLEITGSNDYHAGGLRVGADLNFFMARCVSFYGHSSMSLLYGKCDVKTDITANSNSDQITSNRSPHLIKANCELRGGAKAKIPLYREMAFFTIGLTYDMTIWFDQNEMLNFFHTPQDLQVQPKSGDLTLQGITLTTRLDF